jgi:hypothetical protein
MNYTYIIANYVATALVFVATFMAALAVYRKRMEAGFLWIILSLGCELVLGLISGIPRIVLLSPETFILLRHLPAILALVGWILLARTKKLNQVAEPTPGAAH